MMPVGLGRSCDQRRRSGDPTRFQQEHFNLPDPSADRQCKTAGRNSEQCPSFHSPDSWRRSYSESTKRRRHEDSSTYHIASIASIEARGLQDRGCKCRKPLLGSLCITPIQDQPPTAGREGLALPLESPGLRRLGGGIPSTAALITADPGSSRPQFDRLVPAPWRVSG